MSGQTLNTILATWGYVAVFAFVAVEAAGVPFPGETMLLAGAIYAGTGHLLIPGVIAAAALGGFGGFIVSYTVGRLGGRPLVLRYGAVVRLKPEHLARAESFFGRYGEITVFLGRFVSVGRAFIALCAGINDMSLPRFLVFDLAGAVAWACVFGILGFELGHNLPLLHRVTHVLQLAGITVVVLVVAAVLVVIFRRRLPWIRRPSNHASAPAKPASSPDPGAAPSEPPPQN